MLIGVNRCVVGAPDVSLPLVTNETWGTAASLHNSSESAALILYSLAKT